VPLASICVTNTENSNSHLLYAYFVHIIISPANIPILQTCDTLWSLGWWKRKFVTAFIKEQSSRWYQQNTSWHNKRWSKCHLNSDDIFQLKENERKQSMFQIRSSSSSDKQHNTTEQSTIWTTKLLQNERWSPSVN